MQYFTWNLEQFLPVRVVSRMLISGKTMEQVLLKNILGQVKKEEIVNRWHGFSREWSIIPYQTDSSVCRLT